MNSDFLSKYVHLFGNLHRNPNPRFGKAPHKPILLLAVLDEIERGHIQNNRIELSLDLVLAFRHYWRTLVPANTWQERIANPFRFMVHEGFWQLIKDGAIVSPQSLGDNPTISQLTTEIDWAAVDHDLWQLLQERSAIYHFRTLLMHTYFPDTRGDFQPVRTADIIDYEVERLKTEAQSRFRIRKVAESSDETGYYVRHRLFARTIKELYNYSCAVCSLNVIMDEASHIVEAAHIMPFHEYHNDDPRNGIALCKNHHWGFDNGWFSANSDYKIIVSPRLQNARLYVTSGAQLVLPSRKDCVPAPAALEWHRNKFNF